MNKFKPTIWDTIILAVSVILARVVNALMDAIMVVKAPRGLDLEHLWHGAKWGWWIFSLLAGAFAMRHVAWLLFDRDIKKERDILIRFLVVSGLSIAAGQFVWDVLYKYWKTIEWWRFPWA